MNKILKHIFNGETVLAEKEINEVLDKNAENIRLEMKQDCMFEDVEDVLEGTSDEDLEGCDVCEIETDLTEEELKERRIFYRVTSKGKRLRKIKCGIGKRVATINGIKKCVTFTGSEKVAKKRSIRKATRTKRAKGAGLIRRVVRLRNKAMKKRKAMGIANFKA